MLRRMVRGFETRVYKDDLRFISNRGPTSASWTCFGGIFTNTWCLSAVSECYISEHMASKIPKRDKVISV